MPEVEPYVSLLPFAWAVLAIVIRWRTLSRKWLFAVAALVSAFGIQTIVSAAWDLRPLPQGTYIVRRTQEMSVEEMLRHVEEKNTLAIEQAVVDFICTAPFLWWLSKGLGHESKKIP